MPSTEPSNSLAVDATALHTASLMRPSQRVIHGSSDRAAAAIGTPAGMNPGFSSRQSWTFSAARSLETGCAVVAPVTGSAPPAVSPAVEVILEWQKTQAPAAQLEGSGLFSVEFHSGILWWSGEPAGAVLAVVTDEDLVHVLAAPESGRVRSEPLRPGDRVVLLSHSMVSALSDLELALEMSLGDDPSPSASCIWLLDAADDDGATNDMFVGVWRYLG